MRPPPPAAGRGDGDRDGGEGPRGGGRADGGGALRSVLVVSPLQGVYLPYNSGRSHAGGSERQVNFLIDHLARHRAETNVVVACNRTHGAPRSLTHGHARVYPLLFSRGDPLSLLADRATLRWIARREGVTHVLVRTDPTPLILAVLIARSLPVKVAFSFGTEVWNMGHRRWLSPAHHRVFLSALGHADLVLCQTEGQSRDLAAHGLEGRVVHNVIPPPRGSDAGEGRHLLWVSSLNEHTKRPHLLLPLARAMPEERFVVVGVRLEAQRRYADRVLEGMRGLENVTHLDYVPPDEMPGCYAGAKALVNTSAMEGFPNTFLEAWSAGRPVVSLHVNPDGVLDDPRLGLVTDDPERIRGYVSASGGEGMAAFRMDYVRRHHDPETELGRLVGYLEGV